MKRFAPIILVILSSFANVAARELTDTIEVRFRQSRSEIEPSLNGGKLDAFKKFEHITDIPDADSIYHLRSLRVVGGASPEGTVHINDILSHRRADALVGRFNRSIGCDASAVATYIGRDWRGLKAEVEADTSVPERDTVLTVISEIISSIDAGTPDSEANLNRLKNIGDGSAYRYMYANMFPQLRDAKLYIDYDFTPYYYMKPAPAVSWTVATPVVVPDIKQFWATEKFHRPFYMALKTNLLYDALAVPSISAEFYVGKNFSIVGNWEYGWWDNDSRHRYWRAYGGDVALRWWFGEKAHNKPLTGHHLGVYAGAVTFDFEFGGKGYMGGRPKGTLWDRCMLVSGVEYGYSLPIARRLNIDFTIGFGYAHGEYIEYVPDDGCYVWESVHKLRWFGPTKAEISLVWLIGCGNYNKKGGVR
ncbi:MAG: DUF3575 domain-containing protein [Muribaculaceae bacterium]|nr:DUF3575 domain-containing protein [Muribaculaceae bacterium]